MALIVGSEERSYTLLACFTQGMQKNWTASEQ